MHPELLEGITLLRHHSAFRKDIIVIFMSRYVSVSVRALPRRPEVGTGLPGARVAGDCELPGTAAGNRIWVLCKLLTAEHPSLQLPL